MVIPLVWARVVKVLGRFSDSQSEWTIVKVELLGEQNRQILFQMRGTVHKGDVLPMEEPDREVTRLR